MHTEKYIISGPLLILIDYAYIRRKGLLDHDPNQISLLSDKYVHWPSKPHLKGPQSF